MLDVYPAGEAPIPGADSRSLCRTIRNRGKIDPILVSDPAQVATMLAPVLTGNDLILVQGAGNVGKIARYLSEIKLKPQIRGGRATWLIKSRSCWAEPLRSRTFR